MVKTIVPNLLPSFLGGFGWISVVFLLPLVQLLNTFVYLRDAFSRVNFSYILDIFMMMFWVSSFGLYFLVTSRSFLGAVMFLLGCDVSCLVLSRHVLVFSKSWTGASSSSLSNSVTNE
jgi:hypothetical protein